MIMNQSFIVASLVAICVFVRSVPAETVTFEGLLPGADSVFNGYGAGANSAGFELQSVTFTTNEFGPGWSYSNVINTTLPGFTNQFAAFPGGGSNGAGGVQVGSAYGVVNTGSSTLLNGEPTNGATISFAQPTLLNSLDLANTTYVAQYALNGLDAFGSPDFDANQQFSDGDFFRIRISGFDGAAGTGNSTGVIEYDLANYGGPGVGDDFFLNSWETIDLSGFGLTQSLMFSATSSQISDFGPFGIFSDVPSYAAVDNISFVSAVPEPSSVVLPAAVVGGAICRRRRRRV
ncbi:DUF4465 domain-containing protein [Stieleria varia]|uniref:PEP-CTERM protein-sorting domain-containing protein n=1 Tax=Stieleria varia TaxID=2528005 RepID=A0A5C6AY99_9BACT|nr:DUF4465 domain-containing protein [Stieleria varia]TWU04391.1 hypothetical protein Pla52n_24310 [Stieleria varia]